MVLASSTQGHLYDKYVTQVEVDTSYSYPFQLDHIPVVNYTIQGCNNGRYLPYGEQYCHAESAHFSWGGRIGQTQILSSLFF